MDSCRREDNLTDVYFINKMATYKSDKVDIQASAQSVFRRLSNPENLRELLAKVPEGSLSEDQRAKLDQIELTADSITLSGAPMRSLTLRLTEKREPELIRFSGEGTPVPMALQVDITPLTDTMCQAQVVIELEIPMLLKPMVSGPMQQLVTQVGTLLRHFPAE